MKIDSLSFKVFYITLVTILHAGVNDEPRPAATIAPILALALSLENIKIFQICSFYRTHK